MVRQKEYSRKIYSKVINFFIAKYTYSRSLSEKYTFPRRVRMQF